MHGAGVVGDGDGRGGVPGVPAPSRVVGGRGDRDGRSGQQHASGVEGVDGHVDQERVLHLVAEAAEAGRLRETGVDDPRPAEAVGETPRLVEVGVVPTGLGDHEQPPGLLGVTGEGDGLREGRRARLLPQHRIARVQGVGGDLVVGGGDRHVDHRLGARARGDLEQLGADRDPWPLGLGHQILHGALRGPVHHVDDADEARGIAGQHGADPGPPHPSGADDEHRNGLRPPLRHGAHASFPAASASPTPCPVAPVRNQSVSKRSRKGASRSSTAGRAQRTPLAITRRTSRWW